MHDQHGALLAGMDLLLPTPLPALRVVPDWEETDPHLSRVIAPMDLDPAPRSFQGLSLPYGLP